MDAKTWIDTKLDVLTPAWKPDVRAARALLRARAAAGREPRRLRFAIALASCAMFVVVFSLPATRAVAKHLWDRVFLDHVAVLRVDTEALPWNLSVEPAPKQITTVSTVKAGEELAGFAPALPPDWTFSGPPQLAVIGAIRAHVTLSVPELTVALRRAGVSDIQPRPEWDGVKLRVDVKPMISATYPGDVTLMQLEPIGLTAPAGFAMREFAEAAFRIVGVNANEAGHIAGRFVANPSWFLGVPHNEEAKIQDVALRYGSGILIQEADDDSHDVTTTLIWSVRDRTFLLSGKIAADRAVAIANATPAP